MIDKATTDALEHLRHTQRKCCDDSVAHLAKVIEEQTARITELEKSCSAWANENDLRCSTLGQQEAKIEALTEENANNQAAYLAALTDRQRLMDERLKLVADLTEENARLTGRHNFNSEAAKAMVERMARQSEEIARLREEAQSHCSAAAKAIKEGNELVIENQRLRTAIEGLTKWPDWRQALAGDDSMPGFSLIRIQYQSAMEKHNAEVRRLKAVLESNVRIETLKESEC